MVPIPEAISEEQGALYYPFAGSMRAVLRRSAMRLIRIMALLSQSARSQAYRNGQHRRDRRDPLRIEVGLLDLNIA